jgi:hypothetical protein
MNSTKLKSRAKMVSCPAISALYSWCLYGQCRNTYASRSKRNSESAERSSGVQVRPSRGALQGLLLQRRKNGISEGTLPFYSARSDKFIDSPQVFYHDIHSLLSMEDMWRFRDQPVALDFDLIQSDQFIFPGQAASALDVSDSILRPANGRSSVHGRPNGSGATRPNGSSTTTNVSTAKSGHGLKDQRSLSLRENLALFVSRWCPPIFQANGALI